MRRRSLTGPLLLLAIGGMFLWRNLHPDSDIFSLLSLYWPFILIAWGLMRLVEAMVWSRQGCSIGFTGGEVFLVILICIAGSGIWHARRAGINAAFFDFNLGDSYDYPVSVSAPAASVKRIVLDNPRGNIKVTGADVAEVRVTGQKSIRSYRREEADQANDHTQVELQPEGDRLLIHTNQERVSDNQRISDDLEITVPNGISVEARGTSGDYEIADISGEVRIACDHGDVRLTRVGGDAHLEIGRSELIRALGVKGNVDLQGEGSDIDIEDVGGQVTINGAYRGTLDFQNLAKPLQVEGIRNTQVRVQAVPGRIDMDLSQFTGQNLVGPVHLVTSSRDVKLEQFTASLDLEADHGDIELSPGKLPLPSIDARSSAGQIDLSLPPSAAFDLQAEAENGDAENDFGPQIRKDVEGHTAKLAGKTGDGPTIRLNTRRGSITVRKQDATGATAPEKAPKTGSGSAI